MEERADFFIQAGKLEDDDDLIDELNELEAESAAQELEALEIGSGAVKGNAQPAQPIYAPQAAQKSDEDELKALEAMMSWTPISVLIAI